MKRPGRKQKILFLFYCSEKTESVGAMTSLVPLPQPFLKFLIPYLFTFRRTTQCSVLNIIVTVVVDLGLLQKNYIQNSTNIYWRMEQCVSGHAQYS